VRLACRAHGEGRALVVTPGGPGGYGVLWDWVLAPLTDAFRLVLWDHRGCGGSTPTSECSMAADQADLAAVVAALGGERPVLFGHSYGGMLSLMHALEAPAGELGGLVLANTLASYGDLVAGSQRRADALAPEARARAGDLLGKLVRSEASEAEREEHRSLTSHLGFHDPSHGDRVAGLQHTNYPVRLAVQRDIYLYNARPRLAEVTVPTLVTGSTHDLTCGDVPREIAAGIPGATYAHFEDSAHAPHVEERDRFMGEVRTFLEGLEEP
jgi:pimeloyl-ACP methyl ester carboxylesterase